ncbi:MAG: DUF4115 domain-containing protein [Syntrophorhabdaceae bacterium]|nr:DUF4115 domain-containing protein [Syntrophorhabdaceae bacterium]
MMKKKKDPIGKSLKEIISDINDLTLINKHINSNTQPDVDKEEKEAFANEYKKGVEETTIDVNTPVDNNPFDLKKIGLILKNERTKRGLTTGHISEIMNVRRPIIEALEEARWDRLPHVVYIKGYIKEYADILKVQGLIFPYLKRDIQKNEPNTTKNEYNKKTLLGLIKTRKNILSRATLLYSLIVLLIVGGYFLLDIKQQNKDNLKLEKAVQLSNSNIVTNEKQNPPILTTNKKLLISCHERTWVSIIMDGNEKKEFMLNPGEMVILNAKEKFDILVGNAGGVKFILNGKDINFSGTSGQVKKITL